MTQCNACGGHTQEAFSFGNIYLSNFIGVLNSSDRYPSSELAMMVCDKCGAGQLKDTVNPDLLYKDKYWYYSGINMTMRFALKDLVDKTRASVKSEEGDIWLDIASNDGTLLSYVPFHFYTLGIDPADEKIMNQARQKACDIVNDYFSESAFRTKSPKTNAKIITCAAMFYDLKDPHTFLKDVKNCLRDDGLFVLQLSYTPLMLKQLEFGNITQEHVMYYDFDSITQLLEKHGFRVVDVELNDVNGGSFRLYCTKGETKHFRTPQERDVAEIRMKALYSYEYCNILSNYQMYQDFFHKVNELKKKTMDVLNQANEQGKKVYGYAASTKGNTLLQYFGINSTHLEAIADRNSTKWGLKTIGSEIPICCEEHMRHDKPDYLLILAWHFRDEILKREYDLLQSGTKFIFPSPEFEIVEA